MGRGVASRRIHADRIESLLTRAAWTAYVAAQLPVQRRAPYRSAAAHERAQRRNVRRAVAHAYEHVPFYREAMDRLGLRPADLRTAADLARLPVVGRGDLQREGERFVSRARPIEELIRFRSDGTTGEPVVVYFDPFSLFRGGAVLERRAQLLARLTGRRLRLRRVFVNNVLGTIETTRGEFGRRSLVPTGLRYTDLRLPITDPPEVNAPRIAAFRPDMLRTYGSYAERLFAHVERTGAAFAAPRVVVYGADAMSESGRRLIEETYGATVLSEYGAAEAHHIGLECDRHAGLHLNDDLYPVRIVGADGAEVPDGEPGEVVVSNLVNRGTVLFNYRIGDRARRIPGPCPCGRTLPRLSLPEGRIDDWIETASGEVLHAQAIRALVWPDDHLLLGFQVEQRGRASYAVSLVARAEVDRAALAARVEARFADGLGEGTRTEVRFVDELRRTPGGKVRVVTARAPA